MSKTELEKSAELLANNISGWEQRTLERIGNRIKRTHQLSAYDRKALDNMANIGVDLEEIYKDLAEVTELNISEVQKMYESEMTEQVKRSQALYKATGTPFIPYAENAFAQQLVKNWVGITAGEMLNLSRSKVTGFKMNNSKEFMPIDKAYQQAMDKAIVSVRTGTTDFYTAMRDVITDLGGGVVNYNSGVTRQLDTVVRSNILYGAKQSAGQYQEYIGKQFGADGFEVDYHPHPRPSHEFMGGEMFSYSGKKTIDGVTYEDGKDALDRLEDYGCLHFKTDVILGISESAWDKKELERRKAEDKKLIEYEVNGKTLYKTKYEWQQKQRELERMAREEKRQADFNKSCGNNIKAKEHNKSYRQIRNAYDDLCEKVGLTPTPERMAVYTGNKATKINVNNLKIKPPTLKEKLQTYKRLDIDDEKGYNEWKETYYNKNLPKITENDKRALKKYSDGSYEAINASQRFEKDTEEYKTVCRKYGVKNLDKYSKDANDISNAIKKFDLDEDIVTHRYVTNVDYITGTNSTVDELKKCIGTEYTEKAFTSTCIFENQTKGFGGKTPVHLEILVPKNSKCAYINEFSEKKNLEFEMLIDRNTKYKVADGGSRIVKQTKWNSKTRIWEQVDVEEKYLILEVIE